VGFTGKKRIFRPQFQGKSPDDPYPLVSDGKGRYDPDAVFSGGMGGRNPVNIIAIDGEAIPDGKMAGKGIGGIRDDDEGAGLPVMLEAFSGENRYEFSGRLLADGNTFGRHGRQVDQDAVIAGGCHFLEMDDDSAKNLPGCLRQPVFFIIHTARIARNGKKSRQPQKDSEGHSGKQGKDFLGKGLQRFHGFNLHWKISSYLFKVAHL